MVQSWQSPTQWTLPVCPTCVYSSAAARSCCSGACAILQERRFDFSIGRDRISTEPAPPKHTVLIRTCPFHAYPNLRPWSTRSSDWCSDSFSYSALHCRYGVRSASVSPMCLCVQLSVAPLTEHSALSFSHPQAPGQIFSSASSWNTTQHSSQLCKWRPAPSLGYTGD